MPAESHRVITSFIVHVYAAADDDSAVSPLIGRVESAGNGTSRPFHDLPSLTRILRESIHPPPLRPGPRARAGKR